MVVQAPPASRLVPGNGTEAGVIEDARARQRRHRRAASALLTAAVAAGALILGIAGGGGGGGSGGHAHRQPSGSGAPGHASTSKLFAGAPSTQPNSGVETDACPLAARNRYLPAWSGCVTARLADLSGSSRPDLILIYSSLSHSHPSCCGALSSRRKMYLAKQAMLVVSAKGVATTTPISGARAGALLAIADVSDDPDKEIFIQTGQISSGATAVAYSLHEDRLIPAGATLYYGGDSGAKAGFDCLAGNPQRLIQHQFVLLGPTIDGWWKQTNVTYAWRGPRLVKIAQRTFKHRGQPPADETGIGAGCTTGVS